MLQIIDYSEKAVAVIGDTKEIRNKLKAIGGRFNPRLSCGAGWIFSAKKRAEIEKVLADAETGKTPETAKKTEKKNVAKGFTDHKSEYLDFLRESGAKFYDIQFAKSAFCILKLRGLFVFVEKSNLESKFCVAERMNREMSEALKICDYYRTKEGFIDKNMERRDRDGHHLRWFLYTDDDMKNFNCATIYNCESENDIYRYLGAEISELTADELKEYKAADNAEREHFKKRLETWWKRYGADHVRTYTYWAGR